MALEIEIMRKVPRKEDTCNAVDCTKTEGKVYSIRRLSNILCLFQSKAVPKGFALDTDMLWGANGFY